MGTRSNIIVERSDGKFAISYCHWDGYVEGVGKTLHEHYASQERAEALSALGDISSLSDKAILEAPEGHSYDSPAEGVVIAYGRDRAEPSTAAEVHRTLAAALVDADHAYVYVWQRDLDTWLVGQPDGADTILRRVSDVLNGVDADPVPANPYLQQAQF